MLVLERLFRTDKIAPGLLWRRTGSGSTSTIRGRCGGDGDAKVAEVQDWVSVFEGLRASEAKA
jgi:hypothetical protein